MEFYHGFRQAQTDTNTPLIFAGPWPWYKNGMSKREEHFDRVENLLALILLVQIIKSVSIFVIFLFSQLFPRMQ